MSTPINDGGPAFPFGQVSEATGQPINGFFNPGMTLRDWFAGQALAGDMANESEGVYKNDTELDVLKQRAALIWRMADAMIEARKGGQGV